MTSWFPSGYWQPCASDSESAKNFTSAPVVWFMSQPCESFLIQWLKTIQTRSEDRAPRAHQSTPIPLYFPILLAAFFGHHTLLCGWTPVSGKLQILSSFSHPSVAVWNVQAKDEKLKCACDFHLSQESDPHGSVASVTKLWNRCLF